MDPGTSKTFVARVYKDNEDGTRTYSNYSNELNVSPYTPNTPTLTSKEEDGKITFSITDEGYYNKNGTESIDGWELYVKSSDGNVSLLTSEEPYSYTVDIPYGMKNTYYVRVYIKDSDNEKAYSVYSEEIVIDKEIATPTLEGRLVNNTYANLTAKYSDDSTSNSIDGYEFYRIVDNQLVSICSGTEEACAYNKLIPQTNENFIVKAYVLDNDNNKIYSDESNRVEMLREKIESTGVSIRVYEDYDRILIEPYYGLYYDDIMAEAITGIEVFKVENNNYIQLGDFRNRTEKMYYPLKVGETLTLAVRAYLDSDVRYFSEYKIQVINR